MIFLMTDFIEQHNELTYEFILSFQRHIDKLYDNLLEQNLSRIIEPFSRVEVSKVCSMNFKPPAESLDECGRSAIMGLS